MVVLLHVLVALSSIAFTALLIISPSKFRLKISYGLVAATLGSGTYLAAFYPNHLAQACLSGIAYVSFITIFTTVTRRKVINNIRV